MQNFSEAQKSTCFESTDIVRFFREKEGMNSDLLRARQSYFGPLQSMFLKGCFVILLGCTTTRTVVERPLSPAVYFQLPHPNGKTLDDIQAIFMEKSAPLEADFSLTCDNRYRKLVSKCQSNDELEEGVKDLVRDSPDHYHWCFYSKLLGLELELKNSAGWIGWTGLAHRGMALGEHPEKSKFYFLITHTHWDHILGLPFFEPLYSHKNEVHFYSSKTSKSTFSDLFLGLQRFSHSSVENFQTSNAKFYVVKPGQTFEIEHCVSIKTFQLNHQGITMAYGL